MRPSRATSGTGQVGKLAMTFSATAWHIALQLQRAHQPMRKSKGKTILVFDDNKHGIANVADSIYDPPAWTDDYYARGKNRARSTSSSTLRSQSSLTTSAWCRSPICTPPSSGGTRNSRTTTTPNATRGDSPHR